MERRLYRICAEHKITYITIAHRPALRAYHDIMLSIGDGKQGFSLSSVNRTEAAKRTLAMARAAVMAEGVEESIKAFEEARSAPYSDMRSIAEMPDRSTFGRLIRLVKIGMPEHAVVKSIVLAFFIFVQTAVEDINFGNTGEMFGCLMQQDLRGMVRLCIKGTLLAIGQSVIWESMLFVQREMGADMAQKIENNLTDRFLSKNIFYIMMNLDTRIKDADQRIGEDVHGLFHHAMGDLIIGTLRPISKLLWFTFRIGSLLGYQWTAGLWAYMLVSAVLLKLGMPDFRTMHRKLSKLDAKYKFVHVRMKLCAESIAFFGGGQRELQIVNTRFHALLEHDWERMYVNFKFQIFENIFRTQVPDTLQWVLRFAYGYSKGGSDEAILADGGQQLNRGQTQLVAMCGIVFGELGVLLGLAEKFATISGKAQRVGEFQELLDELEAGMDPGQRIGDRVATKMPRVECDYDDKGEYTARHVVNTEFYLQDAWPEAGGVHIHGEPGAKRDPDARIALEGVDLVTPRGVAVASNISVEVRPGQAVMVTGRNATGKTSFVRVVAGLWPPGKGAVTVPCPAGSTVPGLKDVFVVPQRIHMCIGTLADQITYPTRIPAAKRTAEDEAKLLGLLKMVGIDYLVSRWAGDVDGVTTKDHKGWDHVARWEDVLSLGEQQRSGMARMFYHRPQVGYTMGRCCAEGT
jgi:ABC-type uncharacterized transport system fused permease/ATPase subunit